MEGAEVARLVAAARAGDEAAWKQLVQGYSGLVWSVIRGVGVYGAEANDVAQTVWLRFVEHLGRLREPERAGAWLATTARNEALRVAKRGARMVPTEDVVAVVDAGAGGQVSAEALDRALLAGEQRAVVVEALAVLSEHCRTLLRLLFADPPMAYDDICDVLAMPKGSIGPTRGRCLGHLKAELARRGITA